MPGYNVEIGIDESTAQESANKVKSIFAQTAGSIAATATKISQTMSQKIGRGFVKVAGASKNAAKTLRSSASGMVVSLDGIIVGMQMIGKLGANMMSGFIKNSPASSAAMAKIDFQMKRIYKTFGDSLAPALNDLADLVKGLREQFENLDPTVKSAIVTTLGFVAGLSLAAGAIALVTTVGVGLVATIGGIAVAVGALTWAWQNDFLGIQTSTMEFIKIVQPAFTDLMNTFKQTVGDMFAKITPHFDGIEEQIKEFMVTFGEFFNNIKPALQVLIKIFGVFLTKAIVDVIDTFRFLLDVVIGFMKIFNALIKGDWKEALRIMSGLFDRAIEYIIQRFKNQIDFWVGIFNAFGVDIKKIIKGIVDDIIERFEKFKEDTITVVTFIKDKFMKKVKEIKEGFERSIKKIKKFFTGLKDKAFDMAKKISKSFINFFTNIKDNVNTFKQHFFDAIDAIKDRFLNFFTGVKDGAASIPNIIKGIVNSMITSVNSILVDGINDVLMDIKEVDINGWKPFDWIQKLPTIPLLHFGGEVTRGGLYRLNRGEGVLNAQQMRMIGGLDGLRKIGTTVNNTTISRTTQVIERASTPASPTTITIEKVVLSDVDSFDRFIDEIRRRDFSLFSSSGYDISRF